MLQRSKLGFDHLVRPTHVPLLLLVTRGDFVSAEFVSAVAHLLLSVLYSIYDGSQPGHLHCMVLNYSSQVFSERLLVGDPQFLA